MEHSFDIKIATEYGMAEAVLLKNIYFWCMKNKEDNRNFHDGTYWTYNTAKELQEIFCYLTERQIRYALNKLEKEGLIVSNRFNKTRTDRTKWYTVTDFAISLIESGNEEKEEVNETADSSNLQNVSSNLQNEQLQVTNLSVGSDNDVNSNLQNCQLELTNLSVPTYKNVTAIPDILPDINTNTINTDSTTDGVRPREKPPAKKEVRHKYGEYGNVFLSDKDIEQLDAFEPDWRVWMERVSSYCASHGKSYKNYLATIKNWIRRDREREQERSQWTNKTSRELDDFYQMSADWANGGEYD